MSNYELGERIIDTLAGLAPAVKGPISRRERTMDLECAGLTALWSTI